MNTPLLTHYEAIERSAQDMLEAARLGDWHSVVEIESACKVLISRLKNAASTQPLHPDETKMKSRIMQRILLTDAEIRCLAEPWLEDVGQGFAGNAATLH